MVDLTRLATDGLIFVIIAAVLAVIWRRPWFLVAVVTAGLAADLLSLALRQLTGRDRPFLVYPSPRPLVNPPSSGSFPSGHAAAAFACATVIYSASPRAGIPAFVLAALVAWSRVYVGVHWPLDVIGGAVLGVAVATALLKLEASLRRSRQETPAG